MNNSKSFSIKLKNFLNKITVKQILLIIIFGILISLASCIIGYIEFSTTIKNTYNEQAADIAEFIAQNIDIDEYEKDIKLLNDSFYKLDQPIFKQISNQPGYQELVKQSDYLQNSFKGLDIFIGTYNKDYIAPVIKELESTGDSDDLLIADELKSGVDDIVLSYYRSKNLVPGNRKSNEPGGYFLVDEDEKESLEVLYKEKTLQYLDTEMIMGDTYATSTLFFSVEAPFFNKTGDIIGFVNVSITISVLQALLSRYILLVGLLTILIGVVFILIYIHLNRRMFINPILSIIEGTSNFVKNNNQITENLAEIKTGDEIQTLAESILKLENDINEYIENLAKATKERERVQAELDLATHIQMSMLPQEVPEISERKEFEIAALMNPAREVGGDFYNYFMIDEDHLGFVVGDVSGKGVPAALFMMIGTILIKTESLPNKPVNEIIEKVNDILSENNTEMFFITSWMGIYEISTGIVTFINAGHEPPLLIHENGEAEFVKTKPNMALAVFGGMPYRLNKVKLKKGDKIFLYTDGVVEAQTEEEEFYKNDRLIDIVKTNYKEDINNLVKIIREDIDVFVNGAEQFDDITIVGLEILEEPNSQKMPDF